MLRPVPLYAEIRPSTLASIAVPSRPQPTNNNSLENLTATLKNPLLGKTDKANALLESTLPSERKIQALLAATTRAEVQAPNTLDDLDPPFHLKMTDGVPDLVPLMAAYVEVALLRSPFYEGPRLHAHHRLSQWDIDPLTYSHELKNIWNARNAFNEKLAAAALPKIFATFKGCNLAFSNVGSGNLDEPAWDFNYSKFTQVDFRSLDLSSANNFKQASFDSCRVGGKNGIFNVDALISNSSLVKNFKIAGPYIQNGLTQVSDTQKPLILQNVDNRQVSQPMLKDIAFNPRLLGVLRRAVPITHPANRVEAEVNRTPPDAPACIPAARKTSAAYATIPPHDHPYEEIKHPMAPFNRDKPLPPLPRAPKGKIRLLLAKITPQFLTAGRRPTFRV